MKKRIPTYSIWAMLAGALLITLPLFAQPPGRDGRGMRPDDGSRRTEKLAELLDLTADQSEQWKTLMENHREAARARGEGLSETRAQIRDFASGENPDLETLGQMTLDLHRGMEGMRELREELDDNMEAILTPEQREKFELLREARKSFGPRDQGRGGQRKPGPGRDGR